MKKKLSGPIFADVRQKRKVGDAVSHTTMVEKLSKDTPIYEPVKRARGARSGMTVTKYWCYLFAANEALPPEEKLTDEEILKAMMAEFPNNDWGPFIRRRYTVNVYRNHYNQGRFTGGVKPTTESLRYLDGKIVNNRTGNPDKSLIKKYGKRAYAP